MFAILFAHTLAVPIAALGSAQQSGHTARVKLSSLGKQGGLTCANAHITWSQSAPSQYTGDTATRSLQSMVDIEISSRLKFFHFTHAFWTLSSSPFRHRGLCLGVQLTPMLDAT